MHCLVHLYWYFLLQEVARVSVIQTVAGDQLTMIVFSALGTGCKGAVLTAVISQMATMRMQENVVHVTLSV